MRIIGLSEIFGTPPRRRQQKCATKSRNKESGEKCTGTPARRMPRGEREVPASRTRLLRRQGRLGSRAGIGRGGGQQLQQFLLLLIPLAQGPREQRHLEILEVGDVQRLLHLLFQ